MIRVLVNSLVELDTRLFHVIFGWNGKKALDKCMIYLTRSADGHLYGVLAALILIFDDFRQALEFLAAGIFGFAFELPIYGIIKKKVKRDRPFHSMPCIVHLLAPPDKFSFPSGHTTAAFLMAGLIATCYPLLSWAAFIWAWSVGFSRVYLGLHYPTDVLAGMLFGSAACEVGTLLGARIIPFV